MSEVGDIDVLAAEYVLGTLDGEERAKAQAMLAVDQALAAKVRIWERRLSELHLMVEPVAPDGEIWERIKGKLAIAKAGTAAPAAEAVPAPTAAAVPPTTAATASPAAPAVRTLPSWLTRDRSTASAPTPPTPAPPALTEPVPTEPVPLKPAESEAKTAPESKTESKPGEPGEAQAETPAAAKAAESELSEAKPADSAAEKPVEEAEKPPSAERSEEAAKGAQEERPAEPSAPADEDGTPTGVFDDMPEPTPAGRVVAPSSGPLTGLPSSFTATPVPTLTPAPPATLSVPIPSKPAAPGPAVAVRPERRPRPAAPPKSRGLSRLVATLTTLILLCIAALVAAWRFVPDRLPAPLRPVEVLRAMGIATPVTVVGPPPRRPAPPESRYEE